MDFGYLLYRVNQGHWASRPSWDRVAFESVDLGEATDVSDPQVLAAIEGMSGWADLLLAEERDEYQLFLVALSAVDEDGDEDGVLAEEYRLLHEGDVLPTGRVEVYPRALRPCPL